MGGAVFPTRINGGNDDLLFHGSQKYCIHCPLPHAGHCQPMPPLETPGHAQASLAQSLVGSLLFSPGFWCIQGSVCALQVSISQSCVSSGTSTVGLMATYYKRAYAKPKSAALRARVPVAVHCWPVPPLKHSSFSVSLGSLGPGAHKACLSPLSVSDMNGLWF